MTQTVIPLVKLWGLFTSMFIPCIWNNKCLLYTNICTNKWCKFILNMLLIHHLQGVYKLC